MLDKQQRDNRQLNVGMKANDAGKKLDAGKPSLGLVDRTALEELAKVLDFGKRKYDAHNWRGGITWSRVIDSALRHINAFNDGEDMDPESGLNHIAHAMCNCMFLLNYYRTHKEKDDRYKKELPPGTVIPTNDPRNIALASSTYIEHAPHW